MIFGLFTIIKTLAGENFKKQKTVRKLLKFVYSLSFQNIFNEDFKKVLFLMPKSHKLAQEYLMLLPIFLRKIKRNVW